MKCTQCSTSFDIQPDEIDFLKKMDFAFGGTTIPLPEPVMCSDCRQQIRTSHRNEQYLYQQKSTLSGKNLISLYAPRAPWGKPYKIYSEEEWNSDKWDPTEYGRDFDFGLTFFEQFASLHKDVPKMALMTLGNENSPYTTGTGYCKNCYLINSSEYCEDCYYGKLMQACKNSVDCSYLYDSELCYECFSVYNSYNCIHVSYSRGCRDCWFSEGLLNCKNCFLCTNLKDKEYHFMNEPLDKNEYEKRINEFKGSYRNFEKAKELLSDLRKQRIHKYANIEQSEDCTGDFIKGSKSCIDCYDMNDSQDCRNVIVGVELKDVYDCSNMYVKPELNYQVLGAIGNYHVAFSIYVFHSQDILYCEQMYDSESCFGCVGLRRKKYCIFNKQYTREEYEALVPKIIEHMKKAGEWGRFFPTEYSSFAYNDSLASEYFPLSKDEVLKKGWHWNDFEAYPDHKDSGYEFPDNITDTKDDITKEVLKCKSSGKFYKVIPHELEFYRKMSIPVPRVSPDQRHKDRMALRNPRKLYDRKCDNCQKAIQTTYSPDRPEKVYCEECYLKTVY